MTQKASDTAAIIRRQLKIKTGVAQRLWKENRSYQKEEEDLTRKLDKFLADAAEDWDIKNTRNMLEESRKLIADTSKRLGNAVQDLREYIIGVERDSNLDTGDDELAKAKGVLEEVSV
ncbi:hypothetical protein NLI96_g3748 [Meripilus lineatus]|uniref:Tubulin-specific chaperone A n=1 Tax=Meripilus lineatus TaxID=2056292 RepID=A0AAD5V5U7_9APHY|nr:hypothetical protein NLI96_g3748 [Physisporinus lineatus]